MPEEYQSIAAIGVVVLTIAALVLRVVWRRRKARKGAACPGGCGCKTSTLPSHLETYKDERFSEIHR